MKVSVDAIARYPVHILRTDIPANEEFMAIEVEDETVARWRKTSEEYERMQRQLEVILSKQVDIIMVKRGELKEEAL